jgi:hypothetical protein
LRRSQRKTAELLGGIHTKKTASTNFSGTCKTRNPWNIADCRLILVKDCGIDLDSEVHACLIEKVFPRLATVLGADECIEASKEN